MSRALINRVPKAHKGYKERCPWCPVKAQYQDDYWGFRSLLNSPSHESPKLSDIQKEFKDHKSCRTEKSRKEIKWPTLFSAITCWKRQDHKMPEEAHVKILSNACAVSSVMAHSPPWKKQGQGKKPGQIMCQNNNSIPREKGTNSRIYTE